MSYVYGSIGYVILKNKNNIIIIFADKHDTLLSCEKKINIGDWFLQKFKTSNILLEEVPREDNKLIELWDAPHTQELKKLYLNNSELIIGVDIRPFMITFSWEILNDPDYYNNDTYNISIIAFLKQIDDFFSLKNEFVKKNLYNYNHDCLNNTLLGDHFLLIKTKYREFLKILRSENLFNKKLKIIFDNSKNKLEMINKILDSIMEWYICAHIKISKKKSIIVHAGLAHTDKIVDLLKEHYDFNVLYQTGINTLKEIDFTKTTTRGCINIPTSCNNMF